MNFPRIAGQDKRSRMASPIKIGGGTPHTYEAKHYIKTISNKINLHAIMHSLECFEPTTLQGIQI
jgi:hypothetical protein